MTDDIDNEQRLNERTHKRRKGLYTRCNRRSMFYQLDPGDPCPSCGKGKMV